jgi:CheY-like chemotaxis protein/transcriptional regulator with XRE-family HTH domain
VPLTAQQSTFLAQVGGNVRRLRVGRKLTQERLAELIGVNPRTVQKIEAGKLTLVPTPTDLRQLVGDVAALFESLADKKGLSFVASYSDDVPAWITVDGVRLKQVLTNLVNNAVKFTDRGEVRVSVTRAETGLRFEVRDTGVGISPDALPRLFNAFEQGDPSTTRRYGGTGLGLALSKQLVSLLGGELTVASSPGHGSTFAFEVRLVPAVPPLERAVVPLRPSTSLEVLVVDDNPINRRVAEGLLHKAGYSSLGVTNGREALEALQRASFAAVLMDCHMPVMDGFEATEHIRRLPAPLAHTPVIALTASASSEDREACQRAGMNECLSKPVAFSCSRSRLTTRRRASSPGRFACARRLSAASSAMTAVLTLPASCSCWFAVMRICSISASTHSSRLRASSW